VRAHSHFRSLVSRVRTSLFRKRPGDGLRVRPGVD
jgi:hypothetical protein